MAKTLEAIHEGFACHGVLAQCGVPMNLETHPVILDLYGRRRNILLALESQNLRSCIRGEQPRCGGLEKHGVQ
jgi:hypothetical protein